MVCFTHHDREAVAQCTECGAYVCTDCAQKTASLKDSFGTLCPNCGRNKLEALRDFYRGQRNKKLGRIIGMAICYIAGLILMLVVARKLDMPILSAVGLILCGLYGAIAAWKFASDSIREGEIKSGATYVITDTGMHKETHTWLKIIFFILGVAFGLLLTPINIIRYLVKMSKDGKAARTFELELETF